MNSKVFLHLLIITLFCSAGSTLVAMEASKLNPLREFPDVTYWNLQDQVTPEVVELAQLDTVLVPAGYAYGATTGKDAFLYILGLKEPYTRKDILSSYQKLAEKWNPANFPEQPAKEYAVQVLRLIDKAKNQLIQAHTPLAEFPDVVYYKLHSQITPEQVEKAQTDTVIIPAGYAIGATTGKDVFRYILGLKEPYARKDILNSFQKLATSWEPEKFQDDDSKTFARQVHSLVLKAGNELLRAYNPLAEFPEAVRYDLPNQLTIQDVLAAQADTVLVPAGRVYGAITGKDVFRYLLGLPELFTFKDLQISYQKKAEEFNPAQAQDAPTKEFLAQLSSLITHAKNELVRTHNPLAEFPNAAYLQNQLTLDQVEKAQWNSVLVPGGYLYGTTVNGEDLFRSILGLDKYKPEPLKIGWFGWETSDNAKAIEAAYNKLTHQWNPNQFDEQAQKDLATKVMHLLEKARAEAIKADTQHTEDTKTRAWGNLETAAKYYGAK